ncbi:hypothetical protein C2845_PM08G03030 [Panicum miliaceum]|uniref:DUF1618 domain-containing protein n=1 Tax=Panicum miliaceum TaxID=4540 RepID=A0A3L6R479_PANMI|nr:hypothetical protein C2845_PM08G03030 [Panicum miliaceum]
MGDTLHPGSLHPPTYGDADRADSTRPDWILLDFRAYFADRRNATNAACKTRNGKEIQVTFFPAHRPRVSYFCVHCHGVEPSGFMWEPKVIATGGDFVLLCVSIGHHYAMVYLTLHEYYVYRAGGSTGGPPSLELLPHPDLYYFRGLQIIAALRDDSSGFFRGSSGFGQYDIILFHSEDKVWTAKDVFVPPEQQQQHCSIEEEGFWHKTSKVITIGGKHGTMAFVDLWNGILLYDVFREDPKLRYVPMPPQLYPSRKPNAAPSITRDIAIVKDRIKLVELLKRLPDDEGKPQMSLERLFIGHPTISLDDNDIVYFMTTVENKAWVIAVDMRYKMLQGVAEFGSERTFGIAPTYTQSGISEHLNMSPGTESKGNLKRPGMQLFGSCSKKHFGNSSVADVDVEAADDMITV